MGRRWTIGRWQAPDRAPQPPENAATDIAHAEAEGAPAAGVLRAITESLSTVLEESQREVGRLAGVFEAMAQVTQGMVEDAGAIVGCGGGERMQPVRAGVHRLGEATRSFLHQRLESTTEIVETVKEEAALLARLARQTQAQKAIVRETAMLRVLTNIEVARLGDVGAGFGYLARELDDFATAVAESIGALTAHTEERRKETEETRRALCAELPRVREDYAQLEAALERVQTEVDATVSELQAIPARFQACAGEVGQQIGGLVAAIQANDITRQQMEHVRDALRGISNELETSGGSAEAAGGLKIQSYQVRSIQATVEGWTGQIRTCLEAIAQLAATEILELGRGMLGQERELVGELARIEQVEDRCAADNAKVQASFAAMAGLMQLVGEHLERSRGVRERLQLLMFNSIVEASHLGARADGILEISNSIKRLSGEWSQLTQQSETAMQEIQVLVERNRATMEAFSAGAQEELRSAREETREGLVTLGEAARCAEGRGRQIQEGAGTLRGRMAEVRAAGAQLEACLARLGGVLDGIDAARQSDGPGSTVGSGGRDGEALERRFGAAYTTEMERMVMRAALEGGPLPMSSTGFEGNSVELF